MAELVVSSVRQTIENLLIDEAKFLWGVEGKVEGLQRELKLIRCLLRDADARREHDHTVGEWVAQLRDIAYDAEDIIERYILRVAPKKGQNIIKAYACFMAKCTCLQVHAVGSEIEGLKSRISDIRRSMENRHILNEGERERARAPLRKLTYAHFEEYFIGREDSINELVEKLLNDGEQHRVISIFGMGGLGKTTLAKKVFAHDKVKNHFERFAWVCMSQEYHVRDILERILVKLIPSKRNGVTKMRDDDLLETLYKTQEQKRCIVVLDDIWTKQAWQGLQNAFPFNNTRSKLMITTRNKEVAEYIDLQGFLHEPRCLLDKESWDLLKRAFPKTKEITEDMKIIGDELLKKCGGLPLAIIVLGGLLAVKEWELVSKNINSHLSYDVSKVLALSYDDLPWHLKPCFLYLGSFPKDAKIPVKTVLHMWIAEGLVSLDKFDEEREIIVEDIAEQYLAELVNRGMVQIRFNSSGKIKTCYLHSLMRDLCVSKATQEGFLSILNVQLENGMKDCSSWIARKVESTCKMRRLSLNMRMRDEGIMIPSVKSIGRTTLQLRTLMFFGSIKVWKQVQHIFITCKFLRILKLENLLYVIGNLPKSVGGLVQLRFLSLAGSHIKTLPQSIGNLVCMEFLDLKMPFVWKVTMPNVLWKMRKLRYLHLPESFVVKEKFYEGRKKLRLDTLKNLRTLRNFSLKNNDVNDIGKLTNLRKLTITTYSGSEKLEIFPLLTKFNLEHLQSSSFKFSSWDHPFTKNELSKMSSYRYSCTLSLYKEIEKLPEYKNLPQQLKKLELSGSQLEEDPMPILEKLQHLVLLMLYSNAFVGKEIVCSRGGFPQLKHLVLCYLKNLEKWRVAEGAMPQLSRLGIRQCPNLKEVPEGVHTYDSSEYVTDERWQYCDVWRYIPRGGTTDLDVSYSGEKEDRAGEQHS